MSQPVRWKSHVDATSTGPGEMQKTKSHHNYGLWVKVEGIDPANDTLEVTGEGSADGNHFAPINRGAPAVDDVLYMTADDLTQSDTDDTVYVGYTGSNSFPLEHLRANIVSHSGGFNVTTEIFVSGWTSRGVSFFSHDSI